MLKRTLISFLLLLSIYVNSQVKSDYKTTKQAVAIIGIQCQSESSGGITEETIAEYAKCDVDFISVGALTHSVLNFDLSLKAI